MELLVVLVIVGITVAIGAAAVSRLGERRVDAAARILQGALVGARDRAIHSGQPAGIRLIPDPAFFPVQPSAWPDGTPAAAPGLLDPTGALAYSRIVPIGPAPSYTEGAVTIRPSFGYPSAIRNPNGDPAATGVAAPSLVLEAAPLDARGVPLAPTSWAWNLRVGDRIQIAGAGAWYTVAGPVWIANPEGFVNWGQAGATSPLNPTGNQPVEWLILVDGRDDNANGWADEGWDGVDNNGNGLVDEIAEWEAEAWQGAAGNPAGLVAASYAASRRPVVQSGATEVALPAGVVIDATAALLDGERSRLPVDRSSGLVELLVHPDGTATYSLPYGVPSSMGLGDAFAHFWLAPREAVSAPSLRPVGSAGPIAYPPTAYPIGSAGGVPYYLPIGQVGEGPTSLAGERGLLSLNLRTGGIAITTEMPFFFEGVGDVPAGQAPAGFNNFGRGHYDPGNPFRPSMQGLAQ